MPADPGEGVAAGTAAVLAEADLYPRDVTDPGENWGLLIRWSLHRHAAARLAANLIRWRSPQFQLFLQQFQFDSFFQ
jgi:hypothetical protein